MAAIDGEMMKSEMANFLRQGRWTPPRQHNISQVIYNFKWQVMTKICVFRIKFKISVKITVPFVFKTSGSC